MSPPNAASVLHTLSQTKAMLEQAETAAGECAAHGDDLSDKLRVLSEDFAYNLQLIEDRDKELDACEETIRLIRGDVADRDARISDMQIILADKTAELDNLKAFYQSQDHSHSETIRKMRRDHETVLHSYIEAAQANDQKLNLVETECSLKLKSLTEELDSLRHVDKQFRQLQWEHSDLKKEANTAISNLKHDLQKTHQQLEMLQSNHESQRALYRTEFTSKENALTTQVKVLQEQVDSLSQTIMSHELFIKNQADSHKRNVHELEHLMEQKDRAIEKLSSKVEKTSEKLMKLASISETKIQKLRGQISLEARTYENSIAQMESDFIEEMSRAKREISLKDEQIELLSKKVELCQKDICKYKEKISKMNDTELELKQTLADRKSKFIHSPKLQHLLHRQQKEFEATTHELKRENKQLKADLDRISFEESHVHQQPEQIQAETGQVLQRRVFELEQQNDQLREIIRQMRLDLEAMVNNQPSQESAETSQFNRVIAEEASIANEQLHKLADIVEQKQQLIESLLRATHAQTLAPAAVIQKGGDQWQTSTSSKNVIEENHRLSAENLQLKQRAKELTRKMVATSGERMRLLDTCNSLRAELRNAVAGAVKAVSEAQVQTTAVKMQPLSTKTGVLKDVTSGASITAMGAGYTGAGSKRIAAASNVDAEVQQKGVDPKVEAERKRRQKGVRNWNVVDDY
ncbi:hypothetical protein CcCBS67573_g07422 [Chytriomyces confervae]|uniref:Uncharacterized protein n=1 Tax=Chytriomyces confervae TaxID=246404 RepID=A0A507EWC2_9FUNG|nr:hypothetical protein CcCBS67573_g07422 [Chytriomyces confervae]